MGCCVCVGNTGGMASLVVFLSFVSSSASWFASWGYGMSGLMYSRYIFFFCLRFM